ncbi:MAG: hypothetical protein WD049_02330 [Candidatus Paceibacterota bacterium]
MFSDPPIAFREFIMAEGLTLATIHGAVLEHLRGSNDAAIFGAQAVNAYVDIQRMTQDVDILSSRAEAFSQELCEQLHQRFHIAVRVRTVASGSGFRIYQVRSPRNRHLVDVRYVPELPTCQRIGEILVVAPVELMAMKVVSMTARPKTPKGLTDEADLLRLTQKFPELKRPASPVLYELQRLGASDRALQSWHELVERDTLPDEDDGY